MDTVNRKKTVGTCLSPSHNPDFLNSVDEIIEDVTDRTEFYNPLIHVKVEELWNYTEAEIAQRYEWFTTVPPYISFEGGELLFEATILSAESFASELWLKVNRGFKYRQSVVSSVGAELDAMVNFAFLGDVGGGWKESIHIQQPEDPIFTTWWVYIYKPDAGLNFWVDTGITYDSEVPAEVILDMGSDGFYKVFIDGVEVNLSAPDYYGVVYPPEVLFMSPEGVWMFYLNHVSVGARQIKLSPLTIVTGKQVID